MKKAADAMKAAGSPASAGAGAEEYEYDDDYYNPGDGSLEPKPLSPSSASTPTSKTVPTKTNPSTPSKSSPLSTGGSISRSVSLASLPSSSSTSSPQKLTEKQAILAVAAEIEKHMSYVVGDGAVKASTSGILSG